MSDEEQQRLLDETDDSVTHFTAPNQDTHTLSEAAETNHRNSVDTVEDPSATAGMTHNDMAQWLKTPSSGGHLNKMKHPSKIPEWLTETRIYLCGCVGITALILCMMLVGLKSRHRLGLSASLIGTQDAFSVLKSENDPRSYQYSVLTNGLKVLVISDPVAKRAAAAMDVRVGYFSDPEEIPGLAHLLEHMLFLGTTKYPDENQFGEFLSNHGGSSNAYTEAESTNYHFDIDAPQVELALDMFSGFFEAPLLLKDRIAAEKKAVCSEHQKNIDNDDWRLQQLLHSTSNPAYPYHKFGTGDEESLADRCTLEDEKRSNSSSMALPLHNRHLLRNMANSDTDSTAQTNVKPCISLHDALLNFHRKYYSANRMRLTILAPLPVDKLSALASQYFANVPNTEAPDPSDSFNFPKEPIRLPHQLGMRYDVVPVSDIRQVQMHWFLPGMQHEYRKKIWQYLANLFGDESEGSLKSVLHDAGLANSVMAGPSEEHTHFTIFSITLALTEYGLSNVNRVVDQVYNYVRMVRDHGPQRWLWDQSRALSRVDLRFVQKSPEIDTCSDLAADMQIYEPGDVVVGGFLWEQYDSKAIENAINGLTPSNMAMVVISKSFDGKTEKIEKRYGVKYRERRIEKALASTWAISNAGAAAGRKIHFPLPNTWVPTDFSIWSGIDAAEAARVVTKKPRTFPSMVLSDPGSAAPSSSSIKKNTSSMVLSHGSIEAWHKLDDTFGDPRANIMFTIHNQRRDLDEGADASSGKISSQRRHAIREQLMLELLADVISDVINEKFYSATSAGISYEVDTDSRAILSVTVAGYSQHLPRFVHALTDAILNIFNSSNDPDSVLSAQRFSQILDVYKRSLADWSNDQPYKHARTYVDGLLETPAYLPSEMLAVINDGQSVTLSEVLGAGLRGLKGTCSITSLIHGNLDVETAKKINQEILIGKFASLCSGPNPNANFQKRRGKLPTGFGRVTGESNEAGAQIQPGNAKDTSLLTLDLPEPSKTNVNSAALLQCQLGFESTWGDITLATSLKLLNQMTDDEAFNTLRTKENLGYIVFTYPERKHGALSLTILVESSKFRGEFLAGRIEAFLLSHATKLKAMTLSHFNDVKASVMSTLEEPYMTLTDEVSMQFTVNIPS